MRANMKMLLGKDKEVIILRQENGFKQVALDNILFFEHRDKKVIVHVCAIQDDSNARDIEYILSNISLSDLHKQLSDRSFIRTHRAYLVNFSKIAEYVKLGDRTHEIRLINTEKSAYLSRGYLKEFLKRTAIANG